MAFNPSDYVLKPDLIWFDHHVKVLGESAEAPYWAYFMEMGTGKSFIELMRAVHLYTNGLIDSMVIFAKAGEYNNWQRYLIPGLIAEGIEYEVVTFNSLRYAYGKQTEELRSLMQTDRKRLRILVMNVEAIAFKGGDVLKEFFASARRVLAAMDESTCIKHYDSKRSGLSYGWSAKAAFTNILTGTPVTQSPMDLWGQFMFLKKGCLGFSSYFSFRNTFVDFEQKIYGKRTFKAVAGYKNLDQLNALIRPFSTQLLKVDCLDLPPKVYKKHAIELTPEQQKLYNQMRDEALLEIEGHEIEVTNVLAQITKLHQIACGQLKVGDDEYISIENNRTGALIDLLEDFNGKAIIWASYRQTLIDVVKVLRAKFGKDAVVDYYGGTKEHDREYAVKAFQDPNSPVRFFVANPQSAGYGLTLTQATLAIYYSNGYNLEHRLQSEDRCHRIGQTESVTYIDFVSPDTVDERILDVLRNKKNLAHEVMQTPLTCWI